MDGKNGGLGSVFDSIESSSDKTDEDITRLAAENGGAAEIEVDAGGEDAGVPEFEDALSEQEEDAGAPDGSPSGDGGAETAAAGADGGGERITYSTAENGGDGVRPFDRDKISAADAMSGGGEKPPAIDKQKVLYIIAGVFLFTVVFATFIWPQITKSREIAKRRKPVATENAVTDYSKFVDGRQDGGGESGGPGRPQPGAGREKDATQDEILDSLPPVDPKYQPKDRETAAQQVYYGGGGSAYQVPDTRGDALQSKSINGIKGISSTQKNYLTPEGYSVSYAASGGGSGSSGAESDPSNPYAKYGLPADRNQYASQLLQQYNSTSNSYAQQNDQSGKQSFYNQGRGSVSGQWLPLNSLWQGTIFDAALTSDISTDLPGECTAVVTKNIYSSQDGRYLLIPQNSKLYGSYNSSISYSQSRVQVGWHTLIRPDGYMVNLGNFNATDSKGASGLKGAINDHPFAYLKAIALMSAVNLVNAEFESSAASSDNEYVQNVMANSQEVATTLGEKLIDRAMDVQPTITIRAGTTINIVANTTIELPPLQPWEVTEPYHRK